MQTTLFKSPEKTQKQEKHTQYISAFILAYTADGPAKDVKL